MEFIVRPTENELSQRKLETYSRYCDVMQWGRRDPVKFIQRFMGIELMDFQRYVIYNSWNRDFLLWLACRNWGKSTLLAIYPMARSLLIPNHVTYFIGNTGEQAKETFKKMEKIAKRELESFVGSTDLFMNELVINSSLSDGFIHNPASFQCQLFNGSEIFTLNSDIINIKGKRASLVCYDEAGWFNSELFTQTEQFVNQNENFKLGVGNTNIAWYEPKGFSKQLLYASSASDTSYEFYSKYKNFCEQMILGNPLYFVCDFNVDTVLHPTVSGDPVEPLISQDKVDKAMMDNKEKAERELYNKFSSDTHDGQIVNRSTIMKNEVRRPPLLSNDGSHLFVCAYDSARMHDNSIVGWAELIDDPDMGWIMKIQNVHSMVDIHTKNKTPLRLPEQVQSLKDMIVDYNGVGKPDYENIKCIICDAGAGGQMIGGISDHLLEDWVGKDGKIHKGIIDRDHKANESAVRQYSDAADIMKLVEPRRYRNEVFDAAEQMTKLGVVEFPASADGRDYIITIDDDGNEHQYDLSFEEQLALTQIDLMKDEIVLMCKYSSNGAVTYNYPPEKRNKVPDDRAFVYGLLCWYLAGLRRGQIINKPQAKYTSFDHISFRAPKIK